MIVEIRTVVGRHNKGDMDDGFVPGEEKKADDCTAARFFYRNTTGAVRSHGTNLTKQWRVVAGLVESFSLDM